MILKAFIVGYDCESILDDYSNVDENSCYQVYVLTRGLADPVPTTIDGYSANCSLPLSDTKIREMMDLAYNEDQLGLFTNDV